MYRVDVRITLKKKKNPTTFCNVLSDLQTAIVMMVVNKNIVPGKSCTNHKFDLMLSSRSCL